MIPPGFIISDGIGLMNILFGVTDLISKIQFLINISVMSNWISLGWFRWNSKAFLATTAAIEVDRFRSAADVLQNRRCSDFFQRCILYHTVERIRKINLCSARHLQIWILDFPECPISHPTSHLKQCHWFILILIFSQIEQVSWKNGPINCSINDC